MLYNFEYKNGIRTRIWIDEIPIKECTNKVNIRRIYEAERQDARDIQITVELKIPRDVSNYGMLGLKYKNNSQVADIIININDYEEELYEGNIAIFPDVVHVGIPEDYVYGILKGIEINRSRILKSGIYEFNVGAHGEIGSSEKVFSILSNILLKTLQLKEITPSSIANILDQVLF